MTHSADNVRWDLSDLYVSPSDPQIQQDLDCARRKAAEFEKNFKAPLAKCAKAIPPNFGLSKVLAAYKDIVALTSKAGIYAQLFFAEKTDDNARGAFLQKVRTEITDIHSRTLFWEVAWSRMPEYIAAALLKEPSLSPDLHYLRHLRDLAPHTLSEPEEKIMAILADTGIHAFCRLHEETLNSIPFFIVENGERVKKTEGEVLNLLHSPRREARREAAESLSEGLGANARLLTYLYNMVLADTRSVMKLRNFQEPLQMRNIANEIDLEDVQHLLRSVQEAYPLAQRYYRLKKRLLGLDALKDYDRYAPIAGDASKVGFERCREIVLETYKTFHPKAGEIASLFFERRWIDAEIRTGKAGGGFACQTLPELHPYILVNYTGSLRDVATMAHEIGHGVHQYLSRKAGILECHAPLTLAETASVFGEMLVFEKILANEKEPSRRLNLLCAEIDDHLSTVFRQICLTDFELAAHDAGLREGELSEEKLNALWLEANAKMYGTSVVLTESYRHGWKYIPHFIHTPFYCYAYAFAQLFVLCLFRKYKEEGSSFAGRFLDMLALGGSKKPAEIARQGGADLKDPRLWAKGISLLEELILQAEDLAGQTGR